MIETIEYCIMAVIFCYQLFLFYNTYEKTYSFKRFFNFNKDVIEVSIPQKILDDAESEKIIEEAVYIYENPESEEAEKFKKIRSKKRITFLRSKAKNTSEKNMINQINSYLIKNTSKTIDFHIIQDIVERSLETQEERIERQAPAPLYLGLAATMIGIILGLSSVHLGEDVAQSGKQININPLINGVKVAMTVSVSGLILTSILSIFLIRKAKYDSEINKNEFLSFLQAELMPKMNRAKMPEVKELSDNLKEYSESNLKTVNDLNSLVKQSSESLVIENQILSNVKALDLKKLSTNTVEIFSQSYQLLDGLKDFNSYYIELNKSLKSTSTLVDKLEIFVKNSENVGTVLSGLKTSIDKSEKATSFFNKHIESFSKYNDKVNDAVSKSDIAFKEAIIDLKKTTEKEIEGIDKNISEFDKKLSESFTDAAKKYTELAEKEATKISETFSESKVLMQNLNKLDKLENLDKLERIISNSNKDVVRSIENLSEIFASQANINPVISIGGGTSFIEKLKKSLPSVAFGLVSICAIIYILKTLF